MAACLDLAARWAQVREITNFKSFETVKKVRRLFYQSITRSCFVRYDLLNWQPDAPKAPRLNLNQQGHKQMVRRWPVF